MENNEQYLTWEDYKEFGGSIDLTPFNLLEFQARRKIDIWTSNRLKQINSIDIPLEVKICEYRLINSMCNYDERLESIKGNVASESTDGYSVSYITGNQITEILKSKEAEQNNIIKECLSNVIVNGEHLLYCGVGR